MQITDGSRYAEDTGEEINDDRKSVTSTNEEYDIETMHELDDIIKMFPEKANG